MSAIAFKSSNTESAMFPKGISIARMKKHLPKDTADHIQVYMSSALFQRENIIPIWNPSPPIEMDPREWKYNINIGDVGTFNNEGGFDTLFNIFLSMEQNLERRHTPPDGFIHHQEPTTDIAVKSVTFNDKIMATGLTRISGEKGYALRSGSQFSALHLSSGYRKERLNPWDRPRLLEYLRDHQESWQLHFENNIAGQLQGRPLVVISSRFQTTAYDLAAGSKPSAFKGWKPKVTIRDLTEDGHKSFFWEVDDDAVQTKSLPSRSFAERLDSCFSKMDTNYGTDDRKEIEHCHCIAVEGYALRCKRRVSYGLNF